MIRKIRHGSSLMKVILVALFMGGRIARGGGIYDMRYQIYAPRSLTRTPTRPRSRPRPRTRVRVGVGEGERAPHGKTRVNRKSHVASGVASGPAAPGVNVYTPLNCGGWFRAARRRPSTSGETPD